MSETKYPTFRHEVDGVPYLVEFEYTPREPIFGPEIEIYGVFVEGCEMELSNHLNDTTIGSLEHQAQVLMWDADRRGSKWLFDEPELSRLLPDDGSPLAQAQMVCAEAYQVVGLLLDDLGQFETERAGKILDNLSQHRMVHDDVLPWPSFKEEKEQS